MATDDHVRSEPILAQYLNGKISRAQLFKAALAGAAVAAVPGVASAAGTGSAPSFSFPYFPQVQGTYTPEQPEEIARNLMVGQFLAVSSFTFVVQNASAVGLSGLALTVIQAVLAQEQYHIDFMQKIFPNVAPPITTFTVPPGANDPKAFIAGLEIPTDVATAVHMTAVREFAELGQPLLAKYMYQMGGNEAEQRALFRAIAALSGIPGAIPPNNKAFETDLVLYTRDGPAILAGLGFINGPGPKIPYPGRDAALAVAGPMANAVIQKMPNNATTSVTARDNLTGERT